MCDAVDLLDRAHLKLSAGRQQGRAPGHILIGAAQGAEYIGDTTGNHRVRLRADHQHFFMRRELGGGNTRHHAGGASANDQDIRCCHSHLLLLGQLRVEKGYSDWFIMLHDWIHLSV